MTFHPFFHPRRPRSSSLSTGERRRCPTHSRCQTESYDSDYHPLRSPTFNSPEDITRPHLNRVLTALDNRKVEDKPVETPPLTPQTVVIIHQITPNDSLAGVALRYGISLAELRKANQLWASDSIHLRKSLYIPLNKTSRPVQSSNHIPPSSDTLITINGNSSIRRIPTSKLSFFPPSSNPGSLSPPTETTLSAQRPIHHPVSPPRTLSSILNSLPIAASTRDDIIARLSFDSSSSTSTSDEQEHELANVTPKSRTHPSNPWAIPPKPDKAHECTPPSPVQSHSRTPSVGISLIPLRKSQSETPAKQVAEWVHTSESMQRQATEVRTVQMEPSPSMHLPRTTRSRSRPLDGDHGQPTAVPPLLSWEF